MADLFRTKMDHFQVEAILLTSSNVEALVLWCDGVPVTEHDALQHEVTYVGINVPTLNGMQRAQEGDWIVKSQQLGDFYPVKPHQFEELFEAVVDG